MKSLIIVYSYHHNNTEKIAKVMAEVLKAEVKYPKEVSLGEMQNYNIIGFGAGIDSGKHYKPLLEFAKTLPNVEKKKAFIFSTSGVGGKQKTKKDHLALRSILESRGYIIIEEFACRGFNTNSILKHIGGMNKDRPNAEDLKNAKEFAMKLANSI